VFDSRLWLSRALTVVGLVCLGWFGLVTVHAAVYKREQAEKFEQLRAAQALPAPPAEMIAAPVEPDSALIGMLDIPRLSVSMPVVRGDDAATLELTAGHLPDTPPPWERGNSAIAGHRDGLFRPLKDIRVGDELVVRTARGDLRYRVRDTKIVKPDDLSVLAPTDGHTLTLITCYPFHYVGAAPKRFIVHADRIAPGEPTAVVAVAAPAAVPPRSAEAAKPRKSSVKAAAGKRRPRNSLAKPSVDSQKQKKAQVSAESPRQAGKARRFFQKIGGFFKPPKRQPPPAASPGR